jgi:hypothetical protein
MLIKIYGQSKLYESCTIVKKKKRTDGVLIMNLYLSSFINNKKWRVENGTNSQTLNIQP